MPMDNKFGKISRISACAACKRAGEADCSVWPSADRSAVRNVSGMTDALGKKHVCPSSCGRYPPMVLTAS